MKLSFKQRWEKLSTGKKVATVAGAAVAAAAVATTAVATGRGSKILKELRADKLDLSDKAVKWTKGEANKETIKWYTRFTEGFKSFTKEGKTKFENAKQYIADQAMGKLAVGEDGKLAEGLETEKQLNKLVKMVKNNGSEEQVKNINDIQKNIEGIINKEAPAAEAPAAEAPAQEQ